MGVVAHLHDWTHVNGGSRCQRSGCTAFFPDKLMQTQVTTVFSTTAAHQNKPAQLHMDLQSLMNLYWRVSGGA